MVEFTRDEELEVHSDFGLSLPGLAPVFLGL
jgi:hypothetical protein